MILDWTSNFFFYHLKWCHNRGDTADLCEQLHSHVAAVRRDKNALPATNSRTFCAQKNRRAHRARSNTFVLMSTLMKCAHPNKFHRRASSWISNRQKGFQLKGRLSTSKLIKMNFVSLWHKQIGFSSPLQSKQQKPISVVRYGNANSQFPFHPRLAACFWMSWPDWIRRRLAGGGGDGGGGGITVMSAPGDNAGTQTRKPAAAAASRQ